MSQAKIDVFLKDVLYTYIFIKYWEPEFWTHYWCSIYIKYGAETKDGSISNYIKRKKSSIFIFQLRKYLNMRYILPTSKNWFCFRPTLLFDVCALKKQ